MNRSYSELMQYKTFEDRFRYLQLKGVVAHSTFGNQRYLNQKFYMSKQWRDIRRLVIIRDNGLDLGIRDVGSTKLIVHHINPITIEDLESDWTILLDLENLISVTRETHDAIHYGSLATTGIIEFTERSRFDTCPWKN